MKRFLLLSIIVAMPLRGMQQSEIRILEYSVTAAVNERADGIDGTASVWLQVVADSLRTFRFTVPSAIEIEDIRDIDNDRYGYERIPLIRTSLAYAVELPSYRFRNDSFLVTIRFEATFDTSSGAPIFLNSREFVLPYSSGESWLPQFDHTIASRASLRLTVPDNFTIAGGSSFFAAAETEPGTQWEASHRDPVDLRDFFTLTGSIFWTERRRVSADSLVSVSFLYSPLRFNERFADSLAAYLVDAAVYYKRLTGSDSVRFSQRFILVGENQSQDMTLRAGSAVIKRYSPAFTVFDSTVFYRTVRNRWLIELARSFSPVAGNSPPIFDHGWAGYLATKYVLERHGSPSIERRERLDLMVNALSFYPSIPLAAERTTHPYHSDLLSYKGRYFFLMLEHLLGSGSFDTVIFRHYRRSSVTPAGIDDFRMLCEQEYGSSLVQFFNQWLNRSSVPEFAIRWNTENTQRGISLTTVALEQRGDLFSIPITLSFSIGDKSVPKRVLVEQARHSFTFTFSSPPKNVEIDPQFAVLRWVLDLRILAHARSSLFFRVFDRNIVMAKREAELTLELDPVNATGSAPIAYFSLGTVAVIEKDTEQAKELFLKAMQSATVEESSLFPLFSLVRYANILEMEGNRTDAVSLYERAAAEGWKNPSLYASVIIEAEKYLRTPFVTGDDVWYRIY
jgi:hypothetical protein